MTKKTSFVVFYEHYNLRRLYTNHHYIAIRICCTILLMHMSSKPHSKLDLEVLMLLNLHMYFSLQLRKLHYCSLNCHNCLHLQMKSMHYPISQHDFMHHFNAIRGAATLLRTILLCGVTQCIAKML